MNHSARTNSIIHGKHICIENKHNTTQFFKNNNHRAREPIRDLVDFSKTMHRTREPIRDLENSSFQNLKNEKKRVFPKVSGNCSHTFSLFFANISSLFFKHFVHLILSSDDWARIPTKKKKTICGPMGPRA